MSQRKTCANPNPQVAPINPLAVASDPINNPVAESSVLSEEFGRDQNLKKLLKESPTQDLHKGRERCSQALGRMDYVHGRLFCTDKIQFGGSRNYGKRKIGRTSQAMVEVALTNLGQKGKYSRMG